MLLFAGLDSGAHLLVANPNKRSLKLCFEMGRANVLGSAEAP